MLRSRSVAGALLVVAMAGCGGSSPAEDSAAIIAFTSNRDHEGSSEDFATMNTEIYTMTANGDDIVRITREPGVDLYPRWSGTGSEIAFMSNRDSGTESMDLYVIDIATQAVRHLTTTGGVFGHEWSPDDSTLVYAYESNTGLTVRMIGADGTDDRFVVEGSWPSFSPDGSRILFTQGEFFEEPQRLAIVDIDSGTVTAVPLTLDNASESTWSPGGDRIAFMSNPNGYEGAVEEWDEEIYVAALDGTSVVRVSNRPGNDHWPPSWSADGRCLTWQGDDPDSTDNFASDIIVAAVDGGQPINVTADSSFGELFPDWSPGTCPLSSHP
jgi:Tol biopolymer transport system component